MIYIPAFSIWFVWEVDKWSGSYIRILQVYLHSSQPRNHYVLADLFCSHCRRNFERSLHVLCIHWKRLKYGVATWLLAATFMLSEEGQSSHFLDMSSLNMKDILRTEFSASYIYSNCVLKRNCWLLIIVYWILSSPSSFRDCSIGSAQSNKINVHSVCDTFFGSSRR